MWCVDHGGVVDGGEISVHQIEVIQTQYCGPDGLDLDVGKVLSNAAMTTWEVEAK